jgi:hypothetical protein
VKKSSYAFVRNLTRPPARVQRGPPTPPPSLFGQSNQLKTLEGKIMSYTQNCDCFCGCEEVLESFVPLRGHTECNDCAQGRCISEHYARTHAIRVATTELDRKCAEAQTRAFETAMRWLDLDGFDGSRTAQQYRKDFKDR